MNKKSKTLYYHFKILCIFSYQALIQKKKGGKENGRGSERGAQQKSSNIYIEIKAV